MNNIDTDIEIRVVELKQLKSKLLETIAYNTNWNYSETLKEYAEVLSDIDKVLKETDLLLQRDVYVG